MVGAQACQPWFYSQVNACQAQMVWGASACVCGAHGAHRTCESHRASTRPYEGKKNERTAPSGYPWWCVLKENHVCHASTKSPTTEGVGSNWEQRSSVPISWALG